MQKLKQFVQIKKRETAAQIARRSNKKPSDEAFIRLLQGRLEAFDLMVHYLDRLEEEEILLNGSASAFSPQG